MTEQPGPGPVSAGPVATGTGQPSWYRRHWVHIVAAGLLGIVLGTGIEGTDATETTEMTEPSSTADQATLDRRQNNIDKVESDLAQIKADLDDREAQLDDREAELDEHAELDDREVELDDREAELDKREKAISKEEAAAKANTFPGEGTYLVGTDIQPGTYRGNADSGATCYWARLSNTSGDGIITNDISAGPAVVTIKASDKAFQTHNCGGWKRVG